MAPLKMSNKVARGFRRVSMKFWEVCRSAEVEWSPPWDPPTPPLPPPRVASGGRTGGLRPDYDTTSTRSESVEAKARQKESAEAKTGGLRHDVNAKRKRRSESETTLLTRRQVGGFS